MAYGDERLRTDRYYNLDLVSMRDCAGRYEMPVMEACKRVPGELLPFNYAKTLKRRDCGIHFFVDDYQFERVWSRPLDYVDLLSGFECVLTPDFSLYADMPLPMQYWNEYRRRALGNLWQRHGMNVIPTLSWTDERSFGFAFDGLPKGGVVAVSTVGVYRDKEARAMWLDGFDAAIESIKPEAVVAYGKPIPGVDGKGADIIWHASNSSFRGRL